mmetsp:Transcript_23334/g.81330  ORF Transcript_23334/g.81330 Transcript_23334/m.81330 type:complete len:243 (+) Transcript_23334:2766-3494(+)
MEETCAASSSSSSSAVGVTMTMSAKCGGHTPLAQPASVATPDVWIEMKPENSERSMLMLPDVVSTCTLPPSAILAPSTTTVPDCDAAFRFSRTTTFVARTLPSCERRLKLSDSLSLASTRPLMPLSRTSAPVPSEFSDTTLLTCTSDASPWPCSSQSRNVVSWTMTEPRLVLSATWPRVVPRLTGSQCTSELAMTTSPFVDCARAPFAPILAPSKVTEPMVVDATTRLKRGADSPGDSSTPA